MVGKDCPIKQKGGVVMENKKRGRRKLGGDAKRTARLSILIKEDAKQKLLEIEKILRVLHRARALEEMCGRSASLSTAVELLTEEYAHSLIKKLLREAERKTEQLQEIQQLIIHYLEEDAEHKGEK